MTKLDDRDRATGPFAAGPFEGRDACATPDALPSLGPRIEPVVEKRINARDEADAVVQWLLAQRQAGLAWRDMAVLAPGKRNWRDPIANALQRASIPFRMLLGDPSLAPQLAVDHVHVMTLHAVEGLSFAAVAVLGIGDLPWKSQTDDEAARLLDVATTRATRALTISYSKPSTLVARLLAT